jgi:hypothetical protein
MKLKPKTFRIWPFAMMMLLLPAGNVGTAAINGNAQIRALIADPLSLLAMRSSGGRGAGALVQSKAVYASNDTPPGDFLGLSPEPNLPSEGESFSPMPPLAPEAASDTPQILDPMSFRSLAGSDDLPGSGFLPGAFIGTVGHDLAAGGGGFAANGPGAPPTTPPVLVPPLPPSAVPEPGTWLMIVTGFLAVGSVLRSRQRREAARRTDTVGALPTGDR